MNKLLMGCFLLIMLLVSGKGNIEAQSHNDFMVLDIYGASSSYNVDLSHAQRLHVGPTYPGEPPVGIISGFPKFPEIPFHSFVKDAINLRQGEYLKFIFEPYIAPVRADKVYLLINSLDAYQNTMDRVFGYIHIEFTDSSGNMSYELRIGENISNWWSGIPNSSLSFIFDDSMNIWSYTDADQRWGIGFLELNIPRKVIRSIKIESSDFAFTPPGAATKIPAGLRFMGISLHLNDDLDDSTDITLDDYRKNPISYDEKSIEITGVTVENFGEAPKLYSENFKGIIKAGDFGKGPWMPKIECRAIRKDDPAKTDLTKFGWRLEVNLKDYAFLDNIWLFGEPNPNGNVWTIDWNGLFVGGTMTLIAEADIDGDGIIQDNERDEVFGEIIAETPRKIDVIKFFSNMNDNPPGILRAIAEHESEGINQFKNGYPIINRNPESADCGFMQINTLYWPDCLIGPRYQGLWNWKDNIKAGKYIYESFESDTYRKLTMIVYDLLMPYHSYDPVPYKSDISNIEELYFDFLFGEKFILSVLTRYNGCWHLKDHPDENEFYQPGKDSQGHLVYYGEYYHPEITRDSLGRCNVRWERNNYHNGDFLLQGMKYAEHVYFEHYLKK